MEIRKRSIKQVFHPHWKWEETKSPMWGRVSNRAEWLQRAIEFTGNHLLYGAAMLRVIEEWPVSCEHNLSDVSQNRQAWIGHAACAFAIGCPEDIVRQAWGFLSEEQQRLANAAADRAIEKWEEAQCQNDTQGFLF